MGATPAAVLCLGLYYGAYISEILRGAFQAVPHGQVEVARVLGMHHLLLFRRIVLPQVLANAIPALTGQFTSLVKATSLLSVITIQELTLEGRIVIARTGDPLGTYLAIAVIYLFINSMISAGSVLLERHYRRHF
jgi:polar amino acid transport system permease protein